LEERKEEAERAVQRRRKTTRDRGSKYQRKRDIQVVEDNRLHWCRDIIEEDTISNF
jgi:hypothetical protein